MAGWRTDLAALLCERREQLRAARSTLDSEFQSVANYVIPNRGFFTEEATPGIERNRYVLDSTAPRSLELFASFLHTMLNNPAQQWFQLFVNDREDLKDNRDVALWLEACERAIMSHLTARRANIYSNLHMIYLDLGAFGTGVLYEETSVPRNSNRPSLVTRCYHLSDVDIDEDDGGFVDTLYLRQKFTPRQAKLKWPGNTNLGDSIDKAKGKQLGENVEFVHATVPPDDEIDAHVPKALRGRGTHYSFWINAKDRVIVDDSFYHEFPYQVPRWYRTKNTVFGRSPAMTVLPDIRMVNRMTETVLRGAEKLVDPPLLLPDGGLISPIRLFPGAISYSDGEITPKPLIPPGASRIEVGNDLIAQRQRAIREGFFVPLFISADQPVKTATQVITEADERNRAVSPMLIRVQSELFQDLIKRVFGLLSRAGLLPPPPQVGGQLVVGVEYRSPLTASQRQAEGIAYMRMMDMIAPLGAIDRGIYDNIDVDKAYDILHDANGAPAGLTRSVSERKKVRAARLQQEEEIKRTQTMVEGSGAAAKLLAATRGSGQGGA